MTRQQPVNVQSVAIGTLFGYTCHSYKQLNSDQPEAESEIHRLQMETSMQAYQNKKQTDDVCWYRINVTK